MKNCSSGSGRARYVVACPLVVIMGRQKRRSRGRRRRSEAALLAAKCHDRLLEREVDENMKYQACKEEYNKHAKAIAKREEGLLSRTIYVKNVKDLNDSRNLQLLKAFLATTYGQVEKCRLEQGRKKGGRRGGRQYPRARVRFLNESDAKKVFGKKKLSLVDSPATVSCPTVGHNGFLRIFPSRPYQGMDESSDRNEVVIAGECVHVGHSCSWESLVEDGYVSLDEGDTLRHEFLTEDTIQQKVQLSIELDSRSIQMRLCNGNVDGMISFRFKDVHHGAMGCYFEPAGSSYVLVFRLKRPPKLYTIEHKMNAENVKEEILTRCLELGGVSNETFGRCFALAVQVSRDSLRGMFTESKKLWKLKRFGLIDRNLFSVNDALDIVMCRVSDTGEVATFLSCMTDRRVGLLLRSLIDNGHFSWYHALYDKVAIRDQELNIFELVERIPHFQAIAVLETMSSFSRQTRYPAHEFRSLVLVDDDVRDDFEEAGSLNVPEYCTTTPRLLLTPTRLAVVRFSVEMSNRVVRHFVSEEGFSPESFLRVAIGEENGGRLFVDQLSADVCRRIQRLVLNGISLNGVEYRFLAYSASQLKESSLWMVNVQGSWTIESMRDWMGNFARCETASKVAARMGQCFSTTVVPTEEMPGAWQVKDNIPDVLAVHNGKEMCHSDGTGLINKDVLESLVDGLPLGPNDPSDVSIVQVRFGGAKGTLTAWDFSRLATFEHVLPLSRHDEVLLRPSMVKFEAAYRQLEVVTFGRRIPYYLNRNVILLLKVHGIQDEVFLQMQYHMLNSLDEMIVDQGKALAFLPRLGGIDSSLSSLLMHMIACDLSPAKEPFLFSCLHAIRAHHLMNLRKKSRLFVERGAVLLGGLDETGLLPEGCVFVQVNKEDSSPIWRSFRKTSVFEIITGPVMVTKHPEMHPGDVRMLLAVDIPELRHLKNVVLFSRHGSRPEANKMSGSDLDGDQFAVTWDERLFLRSWNGCRRQECGRWLSTSGESLSMRSDTMIEDARILQVANLDPMDFDVDDSTTFMSEITNVESFLASLFSHISSTSREATVHSGAATTINDTITDGDLLSHFINHAKNDNLGQLASLWLDHANKSGADCEQCLKLAALHSIAVDFPKTGIPADIPKDLFISRSTARPHWREKKDSPSYDCEGIVGRLYNDVVNKMTVDEIQNAFLVPLAGRQYDRHGPILRFIDKNASVETCLSDIYQPRIAIKLGLDLEAAMDTESLEYGLLSEAMDHREQYEERLVGFMDQYGVQCEGELLTGCIRKYHKADRRRQHDVSQAIRMQCHDLRRESRQVFFSSVLEVVLRDDDTLVDDYAALLRLVEAVVTGKWHETLFDESQIQELKRTAYRLASAYYEVTYNTELRWEYSGRNRSSVLFSFPWTVADVIATGLDDPQQPPKFVFIENSP